MTNIPLTEPQREAARRLGRVVALRTVSMIKPEALTRFPPWAQRCLEHITEAITPGGSEVMEDMNTPLGIGFSFGGLGLMVNFLRRPEEKWGTSVKEALDIYFDSCGRCLAELTGEPFPANFLDEFSKGVFTAFISFDHEQRTQFHQGMATALEAEKNLRSENVRPTTATPIYFELLLFMEEISKMKSIPEVYRFLQERFSDSPALLGDPERFRKAANRIQLSFKDQVS